MKRIVQRGNRKTEGMPTEENNVLMLVDLLIR